MFKSHSSLRNIYQKSFLKRSAIKRLRISLPKSTLKPVGQITSNLPKIKSIDLPKNLKGDILRNQNYASTILSHPSIVIGRQLEMLNVFLGFEQANKYAIKDSNGIDIGYMAEEESSMKGSILRQLLKTRRAFHGTVIDLQGNVVLKIDRPVKWFLNSQMSITDANDNIIGEVKQVWHLWRRKYEIFKGAKQLAYIDSPFLSWDFQIKNENERSLASVDRNFSGLMKEIFTDAGQYVVNLDTNTDSVKTLSLDERAIIMATAINIDIDYFSRHSSGVGSGVGGFGFFPFFGMGGSHEGSDEGKEVSDETGSNSISSIGDDDDAFLPDEQSSSFFNFFDDE